MNLPANKVVAAVRASELFDKEFPPNPSYIAPEILPKSGTLLLGGGAKIGKSILMVELSRALATGTPLFGNPYFDVPKAVRVMMVEAENGPRAIKERGSKVFANEERRIWEDNFFVISKEPLLQLDTMTGLKHFASIIEDIRPNVLILDPISFMHSGEENAAWTIGKLFLTFEQFKKLGREQEMSVIISHHFGKPGKVADGYDPLSEYNFRGSSKWKDAPDTIITMNRDKEYDLGEDKEAWRLHMRVLTRHSSSPPEMYVDVNKNDDFRMHYLGAKGELRKLKIKNEPEAKVEVVPKGEQELLFAATS